MGEARARGASGGGGGRGAGGGGGGGGGADAMLAAVATEVAGVLNAPGAGAGVRCAAMEALLWLQARALSPPWLVSVLWFGYGGGLLIMQGV